MGEGNVERGVKTKDESRFGMESSGRPTTKKKAEINFTTFAQYISKVEMRTEREKNIKMRINMELRQN